MKTFHLAVIAIITALAACEAPVPFKREYQPVQQQVSELCLERNPKVIDANFHNDLALALAEHDITPRQYQGPTPDDCPLVLRYIAWYNLSFNSYNPSRFLGRFEVTVFEGSQQIGFMSYNARNAGKDEAKFNRPHTTLALMVQQLFPNT
ncbi:MAG: hypothetical protein AAFV19_00250 [Pseudomonadota bacterium]